MKLEPSPNFAYLACHDARLGAQTDHHFVTDPTAKLFKPRQFCEGLAQRFRQETSDEPGDIRLNRIHDEVPPPSPRVRSRRAKAAEGATPRSIEEP